MTAVLKLLRRKRAMSRSQLEAMIWGLHARINGLESEVYRLRSIGPKS
jgi:hypothetical protein